MPVFTGPASAARGAHTPASPRLAVSWIAIAVLAAVGWAITLMQARSMGNEPGTMGLTLVPFIGLWFAMMCAMMLPSVAPVAVLWARLIGSVVARPVRVARMTLFLAGYLLAWTAFGAVAFWLLVGTGRLHATSPAGAGWLGAVILVCAGAYELTPCKHWCLRQCRSPIGALLHHIRFTGRIRDLRVGFHHGAICVGCCIGLMIVLVAVGVMNVPAMVALAAVIFTEKLWRHGRSFSLAIGILLLLTGFVAVSFPWLLPMMHEARMRALG